MVFLRLASSMTDETELRMANKKRSNKMKWNANRSANALILNKMYGSCLIKKGAIYLWTGNIFCRDVCH